MNNNLDFNDEAVSLVEVISSHDKSRTQSIKVVLIEKDGKQYTALQKWWRRDVEDNWKEGKGFHFDVEDTELIMNDFETVLERLA